MAFRYRDLIYGVRVIDLASRQLRAIEADFTRLGRSGALASEQLSAASSAHAVFADPARRATVGRALTDSGRAAMFAGGTTVAALGIMAYSYAKFQRDATLAATQVTSSLKEIPKVTEEVMNGVLEQMHKYPASSKDMLEAIYNLHSGLTLVGSASDRTKQALGYLDIANKVSVASQTDLGTTTKALISIINNFGQSALKAGHGVGTLGRLANITMAAIRFGKMHLTDFTGALASAVPAARANNQSFVSMAGTIAFLTRHMNSAQQAGIGYARVLDVMQRAAAGGGFKRFGIDITDAHHRLLPLQQIFESIAKHVPSLVQGTFKGGIIQFFKDITAGSGGSGLAGTQQARRVAVFLTQAWKEYLNVSGQVKNDNNELAKSFDALSKQPAVKFAVFMNSLKALGIEIGRAVMPAMTRFLALIQRAIGWFERLSPHTKRVIGEYAAWGAIILTVGGTLSVLAGVLMRSITPIMAIVRWLGLGRIAMRLMGQEGIVLTGTIIRLASATVIGGLIFVMMHWHKQTMAVVDALGGLKTVIPAVLAGLAVLKAGFRAAGESMAISEALMTMGFSLLITAATLAAAYTVMHWERTKKIFKAIAESIVHFFNIAWDEIKIGALAAAYGIVEPFSHLPGFLGGWARRAKDHFSHEMDLLRGDMAKNGQQVADAWSNAFDSAFTGNTARDKKITDHMNKVIGAAQKDPANFEKTLRLRNLVKEITGLEMERQYEPGVFRRTGGAARLARLEREAAAIARAANAVSTTGKAAEKAGHDMKYFDASVQAAGKTAQQWIDLAVKAYRVALLHPQNLQDQIKYEKILAAIKANYTGVELKGIMDVIRADDAKTKKQIKNAQDVANQTKTATDAMVSAYNNIAQEEQSAFGQLFSGPYMQSAAVQNRLQWGQILRPGDLQRDLNSQIKSFTSWNNDIEKLRKRGAPAQLLDQLLQMGPSAAANVHLLTTMNKTQLQNYFDSFKHVQELIKKYTHDQFMGQLQAWRRYGRAAAKAFMMGMTDNQAAITKEMEKLFTNFLRTGTITGTHTTRGTRGTHTTHRTTHNHYQTVVHVHGVDIGTATRKARTHIHRGRRHPGRP